MQHPCTLVEGLTYDESHTVLTQTLPNQQDCFTISSCSHRLVGPRTSKVSCIPGSGRLFDIVLVTNKKIRIILSFSTTCSRERIYPVSLAPNRLHATGGLITKGSYSIVPQASSPSLARDHGYDHTLNTNALSAAALIILGLDELIRTFSRIRDSFSRGDGSMNAHPKLHHLKAYDCKCYTLIKSSRNLDYTEKPQQLALMIYISDLVGLRAKGPPPKVEISQEKAVELFKLPPETDKEDIQLRPDLPQRIATTRKKSEVMSYIMLRTDGRR